MPLPVSFSRIPEALGRLIARSFEWSPLYKEVTIVFEVSDDPYLIGKRMNGTVRGRDDRAGALLIQLDDLLTYCHEESFFDIIVSCPVLRWHGPERLLVTWTAVRFVNASSFSIPAHPRTIGTGRLMLRGRKMRRDR